MEIRGKLEAAGKLVHFTGDEQFQADKNMFYSGKLVCNANYTQSLQRKV